MRISYKVAPGSGIEPRNFALQANLLAILAQDEVGTQ